MTEERPLRVRLQEYATSMRAIVPQLEELVPLVPDPTPLQEGIRVYTLFANDLDNILAGVELKPFLVEGTL